MEEVKLTKELLDKVRHIEGFPIGRDEDIIALSDLPYYTACPNPFIKEYIEKNSKSYIEEIDDYSREPLTVDISEGKNDMFYRFHSYHTKIPHRAIIKYILHYTNPGDVVLDVFSGSGMTGLAAQMCGINDIKFKQLEPFNCAERKAILIDVSPFSTLVSYLYNSHWDYSNYLETIEDMLSQIQKKYGWIYETTHVNGVKGIINFIVWSDVFMCPNCTAEFDLYEYVKSVSDAKVYKCNSCGANISKSGTSANSIKYERVFHSYFDNDLQKVFRQRKRVPVLINYSVGKNNFEKRPDVEDLKLLKRINGEQIKEWFPNSVLPYMHESHERHNLPSLGITHEHHLFTKRDLLILSNIFKEIKKLGPKYYYSFTSAINRINIMNRYMDGLNGNGIVGPLSGTLYVPDLSVERNVLKYVREKLESAKHVKKHALSPDGFCISTQSSTDLSNIPSNCIDYMFIDPPFGENLTYSDLSYIYEMWLNVFTNTEKEAIMNKPQKKGIEEYRKLMNKSFHEMYRTLKPGRWITIAFHNSSNKVWNAIQDCILDAGFVIANVSVLDKKKATTKQLTYMSIVKKDLIISAYKPKNKFLAEFRQKAGQEQAVWDFIKQHLEKLPKYLEKDDKIEIDLERTNYMLYDRMVAFHLKNGYTIPMGAPEFYQGLHQKFPERDGMYFLPQQIPQYEQKRAMANGIGQLSLFVQDERTAIQWARAKLEEKCQTLQELTPQFLKEVNYVRWEKQLELSEILDQNFLQDEKGRWYVPDPNKQADLEKLREKALLREFEQYKEGKGKLKVFRTEAVRAGFKACWKNKDYQTIVKIGQRIPETVIQDDSSLLMYYNNALTRIED